MDPAVGSLNSTHLRRKADRLRLESPTRRRQYLLHQPETTNTEIQIDLEGNVRQPGLPQDNPVKADF